MARQQKNPAEIRLVSHTKERSPALARGILMHRELELGPNLAFEYSPEELSAFTLAMVVAGFGVTRRRIQDPQLVDEIRDQDYLEKYSDVSLRAREYLAQKAGLMRPGDQLLTVASPTFVNHVAARLRRDISVPHGAIEDATEVRLKHIDGTWHGTVSHLIPKKPKS